MYYKYKELKEFFQLNCDDISDLRICYDGEIFKERNRYHAAPTPKGLLRSGAQEFFKQESYKHCAPNGAVLRSCNCKCHFAEGH